MITSDFLSFIVVELEHIRFFHGALQLQLHNAKRDNALVPTCMCNCISSTTKLGLYMHKYNNLLNLAIEVIKMPLRNHLEC